MPKQQRSARQKPTPRRRATAKATAASPAATSNADVHRLLAERQTAVMNGDQDEIARVDRELSKLV